MIISILIVLTYDLGVVVGVFACKVYERVTGLNPFQYGWKNALDGTGVLMAIIYWPLAIFILPLVFIGMWLWVTTSDKLDLLADSLVNIVRKLGRKDES